MEDTQVLSILLLQLPVNLQLFQNRKESGRGGETEKERQSREGRGQRGKKGEGRKKIRVRIEGGTG